MRDDCIAAINAMAEIKYELHFQRKNRLSKEVLEMVLAWPVKMWIESITSISIFFLHRKENNKIEWEPS